MTDQTYMPRYTPPPEGPQKTHFSSFEFVAGFIVAFLVGSLALAILSPDAHEPALRSICNANLRSIGMGIGIYQSGNQDQFPPDFASLVKSNILGNKSLQCPAWQKSLPESQEIPAVCDYVYVSGLTKNVPSELVLAFELPVNHRQLSVGVLYAGMNVKFNLSGFMADLQQTNDYVAEHRRSEP